MDLIDSIKNDNAYIKYKSIVKKWEKYFKTKHARTPSKFDIKEAPSNIKYAYKKYFQLKSAALENSLSICDHAEEFLDSPDPIQQLEGNEVFGPHFEQNFGTESVLPSLPSGQELETLLCKVQKENTHSTNSFIYKQQATTINHTTQPLSPFTADLSKKIFENKKFAIRNPRKSILLSRSQSVNEEKDYNTEKKNEQTSYKQPENESIECLSTNSSFITIDESNNLGSNISLSYSLDDPTNGAKPPKIRELNEAWLERATGQKSQSCNTSIVPGLNKKSLEYTNKFGMANIQLDTTNDKANDYVENSESDEDITLDKLKPALKKRKINEHLSIDTSKYALKNQDNNMSNIVEVEQKLKSGIAISTRNKSNKKETNKKKTIPNKVKIINNDELPPDISEYIPFGVEKDVTPRHLKPIDILKYVDTVKAENKNDVGKLEKKIQDGTLNENFIKINIEKKVFVRGKKNVNYSRYKKQQWKDKKALHASMEFPESGKINCFKCAGIGHMAKYCTAQRGDTLLPLESYEESEMPTLEDMKNIVLNETKCISLTEQLSRTIYEPSPIPESFMKLLADTPSSSSNGIVTSVYTNCHQESPAEIYQALEKFGHKAFKSGQEEAIMRILCGMSTLLILSTGGGKSLCYQLPAYIYSQHFKCITLVISPLVSLMEDQVLSMPEFLKAGCLHTNQPPTQRQKIIQGLQHGTINILLISPEALISGDGSGFGGLFKSLPRIAFACIDEAHCVSQWSHNFRPSYLMICRVLREKLGIKCILGLTATASQPTIKSIISHISVPDGLTGVITNPTLPDNLLLSVSFEKDKDRSLASLINSERISQYNSIIVYCIRRDECERVAAVLRACLQQPGKINMETSNNKRKRMSYIAEAYHAGMSAAQRKKIQKCFMDGTLRIIVATVAFGMGINKSDIRCIIHYNMPSSFESYVQEVGRAGRDGESAYCHVLLNSSNTDKDEFLRHIHSNSVDRPTIRKLLQKVFIPCECCGESQNDIEKNVTNKPRCKGHEVSIPIDTTVEELDLPAENIATMLCYVELHPKKYIKVLNNAYTICKISSYGGPYKILQAAKSCPPLAMAYLMESKRDPEVIKKSIIEFNVIEVAAAIGWESGITKYHLKNLEWISEGVTSKRSQLKIEFNTLGFRIKAPGDLSSIELDSILDELHDSVLFQEKTMLYQLEESHRAFSKLGNCSLEKKLSEQVLLEQSNELKYTIRNYFQRDDNIATDIFLHKRSLDIDRAISDIRALISSYRDCKFTGRSIARIFQGISSPNYPAIIWGRCKFWRSHIHEDFYGLMKLATEQLIQMKTI